MSWSKMCVALAAGVFLTASASAQAIRPGFPHRPGFGRYPFYPYYSSPRLGIGFGFGFDYRPVRPRIYRNAFTADVTYAERAVNDFRAAYEKRGGDPLEVKAEVQRIDENLERMRQEAETFGGVTIRGSELLRDALNRAGVIDQRFKSQNDEFDGRWDRVRGLLERLADTYRIR